MDSELEDKTEDRAAVTLTATVQNSTALSDFLQFQWSEQESSEH